MNTILYVNDYEFKIISDNYNNGYEISFTEDNIKIVIDINPEENRLQLYRFYNSTGIKGLGKKILTILLNHLHSINKINDDTKLYLYTTDNPNKKLIKYYKLLGLKCYNNKDNKVVNGRYSRYVYMKCSIRHFLNLNFEDTFLS